MPTRLLSQMVDPALIADLKAQSKREALIEMTGLIARSPKIKDVDAFREAVLAREDLTSTGIGLSVAIPHAKIRAVTDYVIAIGRCRGGIEFDSLDGQPVRLIFMVGASDRQAIEFVRLLAQIVNLIKDGKTRVALLDAAGPEEVAAAIRATGEKTAP